MRSVRSVAAPAAAGVLMAAAVLTTSGLTVELLRDSRVGAAAWWPSAGLALAVLARAPRTWWPALLAGLIAGNAYTNAHLGASGLAVASLALANTVECVIAAAVLVGRRPRSALLAAPRDGLRLLVGAVSGVCVAGTIVATRCLLDGTPWLPVTRGFVLSHALGLVMLTPLLLVPGRGLRAELRGWRRNTEWGAQLAVATGMACWVFVPHNPQQWPFLLFLPLLWGAARLGPLRAMVSVVAVSTVATWTTLQGRGPFASVGDPLQRQWLLQALLAAMCLATLVMVLSAKSRASALAAVLSRQRALLETQVQLQDSEEQFRLAFDGASAGMYLATLDSGSPGRLFRVNAALCEFLGYDQDELLQHDVWSISDPEDAAIVDRAVADLVGGATTVIRREKRFRRADGTLVWGNLSLSCVRPHTGAPYAMAVVEDITARKQAEATLAHMALHDALTGLPNRTLLADRLEHALAAAQRSGEPVGVLYLDLDGFKEVNDTGGHQAGDELLVEVAARVRATVRPGDTAARLGGDEFAVVCGGIPDGERLTRVAGRLLDALRVPFPLRGGVVSISASIGAVLSTGSTTAEELLRSADAAMYRAKRAGKNRTAVLCELESHVA